MTYRQISSMAGQLPDDPTPTPNGYAVGRWEGDTLVVQSVGFRDGTWLDRNGSPLTEAAKMTERFRRVNYGRLDVELTIDDPEGLHATLYRHAGQQRIVLDTGADGLSLHRQRERRARLIGK